MTNSGESGIGAPAVVPGPHVARIWSPLAVAVFGLLLGYPSGLALAFRNWKALGMRTEIRRHLVGALLISLPFVGVMVFAPDVVGSIFGLVFGIGTFSYLKAKLRSDIAERQDADPGLVIDYRLWYTGFGWVLLGVFVFFLIFLVCVLLLVLARVLPLPE
jgi:hypothetical protein